jgi:integrase
MTELLVNTTHKLRHTFLTWFYDKTGEDLFLAEKIAGHRDKKTLEIYSHIREQIGRERVFAQQRARPLTKVS